MARTVIERFEEKFVPVPHAGCWLWIGTASVYGVFWFKGKMRRANRVSYELYVGPIPAGLMVCHHCDTPLCVNPDHLFLGTSSDNLLDASRKGRLPCVPNAGRFSPLNNPRRQGPPIDRAALRDAVRRMRASDHSFEEIGRLIGVSDRTVRRTYKEMASA